MVEQVGHEPLSRTEDLLYLLADQLGYANWQRSAMRAVDARVSPPDAPDPLRRPGEPEPVDMTVVRFQNWKQLKAEREAG